MDFGNDIGNLISESQTSTESLEQHQFISNLIVDWNEQLNNTQSN
ncbi:9109_t:CDS:2 [Rhizophagus irregularis]|nr:9109_t:CDS:2 [Rhizophagus irregularis]